MYLPGGRGILLFPFGRTESTVCRICQHRADFQSWFISLKHLVLGGNTHKGPRSLNSFSEFLVSLFLAVEFRLAVLRSGK